VNRAIARVSLVVVIGAAWAATRASAQGEWNSARCDIKAGHYLVNSGVLYLKSATETHFADQRQKDLRDALRVLTQALASGGQQKNPAAWYYLGRYYVEMDDAAGADSAFTKAVGLAPSCVKDVNEWRRRKWVPVLNAGVAAWQGGNTDSAIAAFRRANVWYTGEPAGLTYLATLLANAGQPDSAAKYFTLAVAAAQDPKLAKEKKDAMFNLARVYHGMQRYSEAAQVYQDYLKSYPNDVQAKAGLASVYAAMGKRDDATRLYTDMLDHADSADAPDLFRAGQQILSGLTPPDTAAQGVRCRTDTRATARTLTVRQIAARCDSTTRKAMRDFDAGVQEQYRLVERAYEAGLTKNPNDREALFTLAGVAVLAGDTARAVSAAKRLSGLDPLNRASLRMVAQAWQLGGKGDSTLRYLQLADSVPVDVTIGTFTPDAQGATLRGLVTNARPKASPALTLTFEFLDAAGAVVATATQTIAPVASGENQPLEVKASGAGIVAWRYRRS
jgi:tetratricopeptide (TPR) repeat protein